MAGDGIPLNSELKDFLLLASRSDDQFFNSIIENLARYPVDIRTFIEADEYLGLKNVYPAIIESLEHVYHPIIDSYPHPLRVGTEYREVVLTGSLGSGKTYAAVLGILYAIYLLSCLKNPHALFGLDSASEIVFLFQSIRFQTGGVAYKLAREIIEGSKYFTVHYPKDHRIKNEILLPNNIVIRPVSGDVTAAIGMNVASVLLDEMSYMKYHVKSVYADDGGEFDQAQALYASARARIDSRFTKYGRHIVPMFLAGSARHETDFIQQKIKERNEQVKSSGKSSIYVYDKTVWQVKPWDYGDETFRVYLGSGQNPPQIVDSGNKLFESDPTIDVPIEFYSAFTSQSIVHALRDHVGIASNEIGNFIVEIEKTKACFRLDSIFATESCTFLGLDQPKARKSFIDNPRIDRVWICHLDLSRTSDSTGIAFGYVDSWDGPKPNITVAGILEVKPVEGHVIPWQAIIYFIFRLSKIVPLFGVTTDQLGYTYLREQLVPFNYRIGKVSNNPGSTIYHEFVDMIAEGRLSIANHQKTLEELLSLNVDNKTGKVTKPAGGSQDCIDAVVGLVAQLRKMARYQHNPELWVKPIPPEQIQLDDGQYQVINENLITHCKFTGVP